MTKRKIMSDEDREKMYLDMNESVRRRMWEIKIGNQITERLFDLRTNYLLRYGSDPFTMFKLYVDITRGIKLWPSFYQTTQQKH